MSDETNRWREDRRERAEWLHAHETGRLAGLREAAEVARKVADWQAQGWRENPKTDGCGGAIAAANTGMFTVQEILALAEGKEG